MVGINFGSLFIVYCMVRINFGYWLFWYDCGKNGNFKENYLEDKKELC